MSELSRVEDLLKDGVEEPVLPMSELEAILRGEHVKPHSRVAELLLQYNPKDILIEKRIEENGTYYASVDNADGYFKVIVDTPVVPPVVLDHLVETITQNGEYTYTPEHDGYSDAAITVAVPTPQPVVASKNISVNGTYVAADEQLDGYSSVKVEVPDIPAVLDDITITENGNYTPPSGTDGYNDITVQVPGYFKQTLSGLPSPIATFTGADAPLDSLKASIVGVQDLHGYDKPWPAGGGKNKAITKSSSFTTNNVTFTINSDGSIKLSGTADTTGNVKVTDAITLKAETTYTASIGASASVIGYGISGFGIGSYTITPTNDYPYACIQVRTESGTTYNTTIYPQIELGSTASSYEPYENICPISGWMGCEVTKCGKNLYTTKYDGRTYTNLTFSVSDGVLSVVGSVSTTNVWSTSDRTVTESDCILLKAGTYTINKTNVAGIRFYPRVLGSSQSIGYSSQNASHTFSLASDTWIYVNVRADSGFSSETPVALDIQIEKGEEETTFEPYSGNTYTIPFKDSSDNPITVYDGGIDVTGGSGQSLSASKTLNGSENVTWAIQNQTDFQQVFANTVNILSGVKTSGGVQQNAQFDRFKAVKSATGKRVGDAYVDNGWVNFVFATNTFTDSASFKTWLSSNNVQVKYELATPITMQFDPIAIRSDGVTNISVNCGEVTELKYFSMTGSMQEYYLTNGKVGSNVGSYVTVPLDISPMTNGVYKVVLRDEYYSISAYEAFMWNGSTVSVNLYGSNNQSYTLQVTSTTAGLTYWSGAWRDIYADIIKVADLS